MAAKSVRREVPLLNIVVNLQRKSKIVAFIKKSKDNLERNQIIKL